MIRYARIFSVSTDLAETSWLIERCHRAITQQLSELAKIAPTISAQEATKSGLTESIF